MKTRLIILSFAVATMLVSSCSKKGCTDSTASNFSSKASKDDGSCTFYRDAFVGTWNGYDSTEVETTSPKVYHRSVTVSADPSDKTKIIISRVKDNLNVPATVSGTDVTLGGSSTAIPDYVVSGSGSISSNTVTIIYNASFSGKGYLILTK